jgi:lipopolysaccharide/colanic/teichoic acid biosynthesis glycosyltransferase
MLLQRRVVFNGREFTIYNFPTTAWEGASTVQGRRNGNRVTRVGHLLRATGLHELPQLFSVLGGQMSLVGSRPYPVDSNGDPIARSPTQHQLKPGIIGWTQIIRLSREATRAEELSQCVHYERWYIENWSIELDLRVLLRALVSD